MMNLHTAGMVSWCVQNLCHKNALLFLYVAVRFGSSEATLCRATHNSGTGHNYVFTGHSGTKFRVSLYLNLRSLA